MGSLTRTNGEGAPIGIDKLPSPGEARIECRRQRPGVTVADPEPHRDASGRGHSDACWDVLSETREPVAAPEFAIEGPGITELNGEPGSGLIRRGRSSGDESDRAVVQAGEW